CMESLLRGWMSSADSYGPGAEPPLERDCAIQCYRFGIRSRLDLYRSTHGNTHEALEHFVVGRRRVAVLRTVPVAFHVNGGNHSPRATHVLAHLSQPRRMLESQADVRRPAWAKVAIAHQFALLANAYVRAVVGQSGAGVDRRVVAMRVR